MTVILVKETTIVYSRDSTTSMISIQTVAMAIQMTTFLGRMNTVSVAEKTKVMTDVEWHGIRALVVLVAAI